MTGKYNLTESESGEYREKVVKNVSRTRAGGRDYGKIIVPENWIGGRVICLLIDKEEKE